MPRRSGGKFTKAHSEIIDAAEKPIDAANRDPHVTQICICSIKNHKGRGGKAKHSIKFADIDGGLEVKISAPRSVQKFRIYTDNLTETMRAMTAALAT